MTAKPRICLVTRIETRAALVAVAEQWGQDRGVDVAELVFRMRTASVAPPDTDWTARRVRGALCGEREGT